MKYMKSIIRFAALLLLMVCAQTVKAQQTYIMVHKVDGTVLRIAVADVDSVTFREWTGPIFSYEYVDLGLSVKWATCNVGAQSPEQTGGYFAWGETEEKDGCYYDNYKFTDSDGYYTKYNLWQSVGKVDMKYRLDPEDDAAAKLLGEGWRTPTREEFQELLDKCNWNPAVLNGVKGYRVVSQMNNNSIFIPLTGESWQGDTLGYNQYAYYYSNTLSIDRANSASNIYSAYMYQNSDDNYGWYMAYFNRVGGLPIRPVYSSTWVDNVAEVKGVSIEEDNLTIEVGQSSYLSGYVILKDGEMNPEWKTSDALIARVESNGLVFGVTEGQCMIYASYDNYSDSCLVTVIGFEQEMEYVDMGLSVHWATCNIGASSPERVGQYYAWGETEVKAEYDWSTYKYGDSEGYMTKYCPNPAYGVNGYSDSLTVLEPDDDVAQVLWGDDWRMPTYEEITELIENCDFQWIEQGDVIGYYVTSRVEGYEKSSIFLPYNEDMGAVCFWSSSVAFRQSNYASLLVDNTNRYIYARCNGLPIRPVRPNEYYVEPTLTLSSHELTVVVGNYSQISPIVGNSWISPTEVTWISSDTTVATVDIYGTITAKAEGTATITAIYKDQSADCVITVMEASKPQYVDLGLSVKWATFNVGANFETDPGDYFAWGETEPYYASITRDYTDGYVYADWKNGKESGYDSYSYRWITYDNDGVMSVAKYVNNSNYGTVDNKLVLELTDDAANVNWGDGWRTPTYAEFQELFDNCELTWTEINGVYGYVARSYVDGYENNYIFLPAAGGFFGDTGEDFTSYGYYWTSTLYNSNNYAAYYANVENSKLSGYYRYCGFSIRPVRSYDASDVRYIDLDKKELALTINSTGELEVVTLNGAGHQIAIDSLLEVVWSTTDENVATVDNGKVKAVGVGTCTITASYGDMVAECPVIVEDPSQAVPEYVDLGLGVKWATFNVGSFRPEILGDLFAWGETEPYYEAGYAQSTEPVWKDGKVGYNWISYRYAEVDSAGIVTPTKYVSDGKLILEPTDDAATQLWGSEWRTPTLEDFIELAENCYYELVDINGVTGLRFTSNVKGYEGNSIFIPYVGYRSRLAFYDNLYPYWTSTAYENDAIYAYYINFQQRGSFGLDYYTSRFLGMPIRPVQNFDDSNIEGIGLNITENHIAVGKSFKLAAKGLLARREITLSGTVTWTSDDEDVVTVANGVVVAVGTGTATITADYNGNTAECTVVVADPDQIEKEYVDLGLSVNWATLNVGAVTPEDIGDYYAWGETQTKDLYDWSNYKYSDGSENTLTKYCLDGNYGYEGFIDGLTDLDPDDDVAHVKWGGSWRMPTPEEYNELVENCSWEWTNVNGMNGYLITSNVPGYENSSIFLPAAGFFYGNAVKYVGECGDYWTSYAESASSTEFYFEDAYYETGYWDRYIGLAIRPVCKNNNYVDKVILSDNVTILVNETVDGEPVYKVAPRIVADPADSTNQCIMVTAPAYPDNYYDAQLYIAVSDSVELQAGATLELSFRYKADSYVDCSTEIHSVPGQWVAEGPGYVYFSPRWQKYSISTPVMDPDQRVFVINLAYLDEGNNFYFDDIEVNIVDNMADGFFLNTRTMVIEEYSYGYLYSYDNDYNELNQFTKWTSTNDSVAIVNRFGVVEAVGEGTCCILAYYRDYTDSCQVTVMPNNDEPYLEFSYHRVDSRVGHTLWLNYYTNIHDGVYWTSTDDSVAVVDKEGYITAVGVGSCFIVVSVGELSDSCLVNVLDEEPEYVDSLISHDFVVDSLQAYFYYTTSSFSYEMMAQFGADDSTGLMVCTRYIAALSFKSAQDAQDAYDSMTSGLSQEEIESMNFEFIKDEESSGFTYTYPSILGMAKESVVTMMRQTYDSMVDESGQSEYQESQEG